MKKPRGFTLLELLTVTTIIALMATIVLVHVRGTELKARDANTKSYMHQLRNAAEMSYHQQEPENYDAVCDEADNSLSNTGEFGIIEQAIQRENGNQKVTCIESADKKSFAASSPLRARPGKHWCVEAAGLSIEIDNPVTSDRCVP